MQENRGLIRLHRIEPDVVEVAEVRDLRFILGWWSMPYLLTSKVRESRLLVFSKQLCY